MAYKWVIFDLDGTLINSLEDLGDSVNFMLEQLGRPARSMEEIRSFVGNGVVKLVVRALGADASEADTEKGIALFRANYNQNMENKTRPYPGVLTMLESLQKRGVGCAVVSNKYDTAVKSLCKKYFGTLVPVAIGEGGHIAKKPAPEGTLEAMRLLHADPDATLYVGDSDVDVMTAHNAHLPCAGVTWGFRSREHLLSAGAEFILDDTQALTAHILS